MKRFSVLFVSFTILLGLAVHGQAGDKGKKTKPAKDYPFVVAPTEAFAVLAELKKVTGQDLAIAKLEAEVFADLADGKKDKWSFTALSLLASGVTDPDRLKELEGNLDKLEAEAREAVAKGKDDRAKGDLLLRFLHAGPMAKGYEAKQTLLGGVLQTKRFNCVSSAVLYNVMGRRLGLDVRAVEIPGTFMTGHVFSVLRTDGVIIDVETTNKEGFNPKGKRERPDGVGFDPVKQRKEKREVGDTELAAIIYYNRAVELSHDKKYHEALIMNFRALCLDPGSPSAAQNVRADLTNWGPKLADGGDFEAGLLVLSLGLKFAPDDSGLKNNHQTIWLRYAHATMKNGKEDDALAIAKRAAAVLKGREVDRLPSDLFATAGDELIKAGKWDDALKLGKRGLDKLDGANAKELASWRAGVFLRWEEDCRKKKDWNGAYTVLEKGQAEYPKDARFANNIVFNAQEQLKDTAAKEPAKLGEVVAGLRKRYPGVKGIDNAVGNLVRQEVRKKTDKKQYEEALQVLQERKNLFADAKDAQQVGVSIYDQWARAKKGDGLKAMLEVYVKGLKAYPDDKLLTQNAVAFVDMEGVPLMNKKKWAEAQEIFETGLRYLPGNAALEKRLKACQKEQKK